MIIVPVLEEIESALLALGLKDEDGPMSAPEVAGIVGAEMGADWARFEDLLERGEIDPEGYRDGMLALIKAYQARVFHRRFSVRINELYLDQKELGIA